MTDDIIIALDDIMCICENYSDGETLDPAVSLDLVHKIAEELRRRIGTMDNKEINEVFLQLSDIAKRLQWSGEPMLINSASEIFEITDVLFDYLSDTAVKEKTNDC